jgi:hypothetical protein
MFETWVVEQNGFILIPIVIVLSLISIYSPYTIRKPHAFYNLKIMEVGDRIMKN